MVANGKVKCVMSPEAVGTTPMLILIELSFNYEIEVHITILMRNADG